MIGSISGARPRLRISRTLLAQREQVFKAWTEPQELKQWFGVADGYLTPIAQVDLRVGGRYRLGMQPPDSQQILVAEGIYREVIRPEKLVFTWRWETPNFTDPYTLVTVEFFSRGNMTEVVLTHEGFENEPQRDQHQEGWLGCLEQLEKRLHKEALETKS